MNRGLLMKTADRTLLHYIASAAYNLRQAEEYMADYDELEHVSYLKGMRADWPRMSRLYKHRAYADMDAAMSFVEDLYEEDLIDYEDWYTIKHWLRWFGIPAEDRYD